VLLLTWLACFFNNSLFKGLQFAIHQTVDKAAIPVSRFFLCCMYRAVCRQFKSKPTNIKFANAQQAKSIYSYKNIKQVHLLV
jgi:hypothetical protein